MKSECEKKMQNVNQRLLPVRHICVTEQMRAVESKPCGTDEPGRYGSSHLVIVHDAQSDKRAFVLNYI